MRSPRITALEWGRVDVESHGQFKDVKLYPGGARAWDWTETGTDHVPGIQPADVEELLQRGARIVVLSRGMLLVLQVEPETLAFLEHHGAATHVLETTAAVELYNELAATEAVGALIHSTC